jgi:tetratricopeptide (TPR) repeat protein
MKAEPGPSSSTTDALTGAAESDAGHGAEDDWLQAAREARDAGHIIEARSLLERAAQRFPGSAGVTHDLARVAEAMRDWPAAEQHWRTFLTRATHLWWAYTSLANVLREQGRLQEANAVLTEQFVPLAQEPGIFFEFARLAERADDWLEAARRWADATARFPHLWDGYSGQSRALRQRGDTAAARHLLTEASVGFPDMAQPFQDMAQLAEADQDWVAAEQAWRGFLTCDGARWWAHTGLARALRRQRRFDEADAVLIPQFTRLAPESGLLFEHAAIAEDRGDWAEAAERYRTLVHRYPDQPHAARGLCYMLARMGRRAEGDDILRQAIATNPRDLGLRLAFARNAAEVGVDGAPAFLTRSTQTLLDFPDEAQAHGFLADAFGANGLFSKAEDCLASACARFPNDADLLIRWAANLAQQSKWDSALTVFDALDGVRSPDEQTEHDRANLLITARRWQAAEARITAALDLFPASVGLHVLRLDLMISSDRLDSAIGQWRAIDRNFPAAAGALSERRTRMLGLGCDPLDTDLAASHPVRAEDVVSQFESLGGWGLGCEFGLVQRAMGAEPLGLLRWADIDTDGLIDAMESGFEGVGKADQTLVETTGGALDEYVSKDRRFGMRVHTYVPSGQVAPERMLAQTCRRLSFLRQKLLDDLRCAAKILVYKNARRPLTDPDLERLRLAIRRYGDNTLLYVRYQTEEHRFPSVIAPAPGLLIGHIDTMGLTRDGAPVPIPFASWATLALAAHGMWKAAAVAGAGPLDRTALTCPAGTC